MPFRICLLLFFALIPAGLYAQAVTGSVYDARLGTPIPGCNVQIGGNNMRLLTTDTGGHFAGTVPPGMHHITITHLGYAPYRQNIQVKNAPLALGSIYLRDTGTVLDEVKIVEKILAVVQKNDTTEYDAGAYKTNPDADAADMVKKMPGVDVNGSSVKAQGETVTKVLIDGKPFFGNDPYAALRTLPAEVIAKVQVYNEKSEQELFTGFSEGGTTKTINIVTKTDKRNGVFGKVNAGAGEDNTYGADANLNSFDHDRRITLTAQSNNINIQNFTSQQAGPAQALGTAHTNAAGINYTDKWGKNADISGSYFFNETDNNVASQLQRRYLATADSGQLYNENNSALSTSYNHRINARINYTIDSANTLLLQPQLSLQKNNRGNGRYGATTQADTLLNQTSSDRTGTTNGYNFAANLLYRHKFKKAGRTLSVNLNGSNNYNHTNALLNARDEYYGGTIPSDTIAQQKPGTHNTWNMAANAAYTEQISQISQLQLQYTFTYIPARANDYTYNYANAAQTYSAPDTLLSNALRSRSVLHKAGGSYQVHGKNITASAGLYYQATNFTNSQFFPYTYQLGHTYQNLLPAASLQYKLSKNRNLQVNYNAGTTVPGITQLQSVVNNTDPLHLSTGNPALRQPYNHSATLRYNAVNAVTASNFYISAGGNYTRHAITNSTIIAQHDTVIQQNIALPTGAQLAMPVNIDGLWTLNASAGYGRPLKAIKCNLSTGINTSVTHTPLIVNGIYSHQDTRSGGLNLSLSSNISENVDFNFSTACTLSSSTNALNPNLDALSVNEGTQGNVNIIFWKGLVYNTQFSYQVNAGLAAGYNQNYFLWNMSFGKKLGRKRLADIRLVAYDLLNQGTNIQHTIADTYVQDTRTNVLHRYFMVLFNYKIRSYAR